MIIGWDTETVNGEVILIANSEGEYKLFPSPEDIFNLFIKYPNPYYNYWYNIFYDTQAIIKTLCKNMDKENSIKYINQINGIKYNDWIIRKLDRKVLSVYLNYTEDEKYHRLIPVPGKKTGSFTSYDIAQFYKVKGKILKLNEAGKQYLGMEKDEINDIANIDINLIKNNSEYRNNLIKYCITDSYITAKLAERFLSLSYPIIPTRKLISEGFLSQKYIELYLRHNHLENEYKPEWVHEYIPLFGQLYYGGRFECIKKGFHPSIYEYDIKSAYPFFTKQLKGLSGEIYENELKRMDNCYNYYRVILSPYKFHINPLPFRDKHNIIYYPYLENETEKWITDSDMDTLNRLGIHFKIVQSIHFEKTDNYLFPIDELFHQKETSEYGYIFKIILNAIYGKSIETVPIWHEISIDDENIYRIPESNNYKISKIGNEIFRFKKTYKFGKLFNPIFAIEITSNTRNMIYNKILDYDLIDDILLISTDSFHTTKEIPIHNNGILGCWTGEQLNNFLCIGTGRYTSMEKSRFRGFRKINDSDMKAIIEHGKMFLKRLITLKQISDKFKFNDLNTFQENEFQVDIYKDCKRSFPEFKKEKIYTELIPSLPIPYSDNKIYPFKGYLSPVPVPE